MTSTSLRSKIDTAGSAITRRGRASCHWPVTALSAALGFEDVAEAGWQRQ
jgi:hypothetical protein